MTAYIVEKIIEKEIPEGILLGFGGQTALNCGVELFQKGILEKHNIPAIINTASGGLIKPLKYNTKLFHFVKQVPYDWIFPKIYAVIHHGGSGTTHAAIKHGCATMIIPHMIDQYAWNDIVNDLDIGPVGIAISKIKSKNLEPKILDLFLNQSYKIKAHNISKKIEEENYKESLYETIIE